MASVKTGESMINRPTGLESNWKRKYDLGGDGVWRRVGVWALVWLVIPVLVGTVGAQEGGLPFRVEEKGLQQLRESGIEAIVFVSRLPYDDPHWYANIGYYCDDENHKAYAGNGQLGEGKIFKLDVRAGEVSVLFDADGGGVRDPQIHYDGKTVLFSSRRRGEDYYHLYEIQTDGSGLRQVTEGEFDDFEATYLPDDQIVFVSTRSKRWVNCWLTQVATLFRCDRNGGQVEPLSFNNEHDNTPAVLPDGRILYTRWEYVDRSQVGYHHLWTMNPDGTNVMVYYGNQQHYPLFIDAKPIPGSDRILLIDSPGHGSNEHRGHVATLTSRLGPDAPGGLRRVTRQGRFNDPYPLDGESFIVASYKQILVGRMDGSVTPVLTCTNEKVNLHEPVPLMPRVREKRFVDTTDPESATGEMVLANVYEGRNMAGVKPGEIKKLLILESLPKPVNFSGGMDLTSWLGTFTLERVLGTVPVEADGSAYFEAPAGRPVIFVALDENDLSVKRMQSFTNVLPGERLSCVGCHEPRGQTPAPIRANTLAAMNRPASKIVPFEGYPDVLDFRRDIQPILNQHCVKCHNYQKPRAHVILTDDLGFSWTISYFSLIFKDQIADGQNGFGNTAPRTVGSAASGLMKKINGHKGVHVSEQEWRTVWLWLESGAPYAGTYAALRNQEQQNQRGHAWAVFGSQPMGQCQQCHSREKQAPPLPYDISEEEKQPYFKEKHYAVHQRIVNDKLLRFRADYLVNVTRPEWSPILLGPLAKEAGGWGTCAYRIDSKESADYQAMLAALRQSKSKLDSFNSFGTPSFRPNRQYLREMKKYGVLPESFDIEKDPFDPFEVDQAYWRLFWYDPDRENKWAYLVGKK